MWRWLIVPIILTGCEPRASECFLGVWQAPALTCRTTCPGQPECAASDCALVSLFALNPDGGTVDVSVTTSVATGQKGDHFHRNHRGPGTRGKPVQKICLC